jgi:hypothetical protein
MNKSHIDKIVGHGWNAQRRAAFYHILLHDVRHSFYWKHTKYCPFCGAVLEYDGHDDDCLLWKIENALNSDNDAIKKMLEDWARENATTNPPPTPN